MDFLTKRLVPLSATVCDVVGHKSVRFPEELEARIVARAKSEDRSFSYVVVKTLDKALGGAGSDQPTGGNTAAPSVPARPASSRASEAQVVQNKIAGLKPASQVPQSRASPRRHGPTCRCAVCKPV